MEPTFNYNKITGIHIELTTKCNAMCPMCNRNFKGKVRKNLPMLELSLEDIKKIIPVDFAKQLELVSLCGVYGEPICNKDVLEIIKYFYCSNPNIDIDLYTNGSLYNDTWWQKLASIMKNHKGTVIFGIDGIGETHTIHRCNTSYDKVISNAKSFIKAGGNAQWDYIVFKHNELQVEEARKLSKKLGFNSFQIKKTSRFFKNLFEKDDKLDSTILDYGKHPVYNPNGDIINYLELPDNYEYRNKSENNLLKIINEYGSLNNYFDKNEIECVAIKSGGIFLSAKGEIFPCCTFYQQVCYKTIHDVTDKDELNEYDIYKKYNVNGLEHSIKEIIESGFFEEISNKFKCKCISLGKPKSCSRTCGKDLNFHTNTHTTEIKYNVRGKK